MTGVERHQYMDNNLSDIMRETYSKEERIRDKFLSEQDHKRRAEKAERIAAGLIKPAEAVHEDLPVPAPPTRKMTQKEMETKLGLELSKRIYESLNPVEKSAAWKAPLLVVVLIGTFAFFSAWCAREFGNTKNLWKKLVPGYQIGSHSTQSRFHEDFKYDPSELEPVVKTHCRRRDEFTNYVEAAARYKQMMGKKG